MELVRNFTALNKGDASLAGGKGASLGEMTQAGIPVPPGFVVLADSFEQFLRETDLLQEIDNILDNVKHDEIHTVEAASERIKDLILSKEIPADIKKEIEKHFKKLGTKYVAVRSSATAEDGKDHAWAGQLESYLNTTEKELLEKVKHCWASLFTPRAIFYRFEKGLHMTKISVAVVVQKMVESEISGIAFSVHPVTEDYNQLIIEAGFGLGEAIVSGQITPDSYVVEKSPRRIIDINISKQDKGMYRKENGGNIWRELGEKGKSQVLSEKQILELAELILQIENHYGFPCDIEWAYEGGKFYITQSRPITTLSNIVAEKSKTAERAFIKTSSRDYSLQFVDLRSRSLQYILEEVLGIAIQEKPFYITIKTTEGADTYLDKNLLHAAIAQLIGKIQSEPDFIENIFAGFDILHQKIKETSEIKGLLPDLIRIVGYASLFLLIPTIEQLPESVRNRAMEYREKYHALYDEVDSFLVFITEQVFGDKPARYLTIDECINNIEINDAMILERQKGYIFDGDLKSVTAAEFFAKENIIIESDEPKQVFKKMATRNFSIIMQEAWSRAHKENLIEKLDLKEYPFDPIYIYFMKDGVEEMWKNVKATRWIHEKLMEKFNSDTSFFPKLYKRYFKQLKEIEPLLEKDIQTVDELRKFLDKVFKAINDYVILFISLRIKGLPKNYLELARTFRDQDSFFADCNTAVWKALNTLYPDFGYLAVYITDEEIGKPINIEELKKRDNGFVVIPGIFTGKISFEDLEKKFPEYAFEAEIGEQDEEGLKGQSAYSGKATGIVRIVKRKDQVQQVLEGEIIVSPMTTPDMVPAMRKAAAFVTDEGGITCHAAIIARELKKPCIIGTKIATQIFKDGDEIEVDAEKGIVRILNKNKETDHFDVDIDEYQLLFQLPNMPFLFHDHFVENYKMLHCLCFYNPSNSKWYSYIPKSVTHVTLKDGLELFSNDESFADYHNAFQDYITVSDEFFKDVLSKEDFTKAELEQFFAYTERLHFYYIKTEFFYTDHFYLQSTTDTSLADKVILLGEIKNMARAYLNKIFLVDDSYLSQMLAKLSAKFSVPVQDVLQYSMSEVIDLFEGLHQDQSVVASRNHAYVTKAHEGKKFLLSGKDALEYIEKFLHSSDETLTKLTGTVAHKGKVIGKARVMNYGFGDFGKLHALMDEMEKGEILIADTTSPELMSACKKASAILTNQGGLMAHAAIVSREMNIPCIVGLGNATEMIKTGDMIEVDANLGVVTKLN